MSKDNKEYLEKIKLSLSNTKINDISIAKELESSFMDYAMSVITARALPDVKDGLKPVHRRILYAAYNLAMVHDKPYKKSARLVGEVIGKFHPHGDRAVYEAIVRMAQDFSLRYPLIDGHGNFGSIDGDSAAAMRYTEARLSKIACEMLKDIEKDTINFNENYDGSEIEPAILPAAFPNLLANGSTGIAVGMSTVIPPHNLSELIDSAKFVANNRQCTIEEIMQYLKGPDFPTYAEIVGFSGIKNYFSTGKGTITVRCKYEIKQYENGKSAIIITQLPYMINKANLIEKIVRLVKDEIITGISDLRDESSREGIRIIIETKKDVIAEILLNKLFKSTDLQTNITVNIISLVNGVPTQLNIKDCLIYFIDHQLDVLLRKTNFELKKATAREHILEGLFIAVNNIDIIIKIIREASTNEQCESQLMVKFALTKEQTKAILDMRLRNLSNLEKERIEKELAEIRVLIKELSEIISNKAKQITIISQNLDEIKTKYGDERRSEILYNESSQIDDESLIPVEDIVITLSKKGYLKRMNADIYKTQNRGGVGVIGASTYEDDDVNNILTTTTHTDLLFFSDKGKVYRIRAHQIPNCSRQSKGMPALNLINIEKNEQILTILPINDYEEKFLFFVTVNGIVKKTMLREYSSIKANGKLAIILKENDLLQNVFITNGNDEIYLGTYKGKIIRFKETNVRPMGRTSSGVVGAKIEKEDDYIVGSSSSNNGKLLLTIGENGFGKISDVNKFRQTNRASRGVTALRINEKTGNMIFASAIYGDEDLFILTSAGKINRISLKTIRVIGRNTSGVKLINLANDVKIKSAAIFNNKEKNNENE